jgi:glutathione S-transferase
MLTIWGRANSLNVQKVMWTLAELGVPHRRLDLGGAFGGNDQPEYRAKNPNGLVPLLEQEDGFTLWESNTIVRYLATRYGAGSLCPDDPVRRADSERWMDWAISTAQPTVNPIFMGLIRKIAGTTDPALIEAARRRSEVIWKVVEARLADRPYLGGGTLTIGDIPVGAWAHRWLNLPIERPSMPLIEAWYRRLGEREAFRTHVMMPLT